MRALIGLLALQVVAGITFFVFWIFGGKIPGNIAAAVVLLGLIFALKQEILRAETAIAVGLVISVLGLGYPWPWVRMSDHTEALTATAKAGTSFNDCICVELDVPEAHHPDNIGLPPSSAYKVCTPKPNERMERWIATGTVGSTWSFTYRRFLLDGPELYAYNMDTVDGIDTRQLYFRECEQ